VLDRREKWSALKLAHTKEQRARIMACIQRLNVQEGKAIERAVLRIGEGILPRPHLRAQIRAWYYKRWLYLLGEYEKVLPHVSELPDEVVESAVRRYLMDEE
jgi:hypothetical protein